MKDATEYGPNGAEGCPRGWWDAPTPFNPGAQVAGEPVAAFVNDGRWVLCCPARGCGGAQLAALDDPRFMCVACGNQANAGRWLPVTFPKAMPDIVAALQVRADPAAQNWVPGEALADLLAQNLALDDVKEQS